MNYIVDLIYTSLSSIQIYVKDCKMFYLWTLGVAFSYIGNKNTRESTWNGIYTNTNDWKYVRIQMECIRNYKIYPRNQMLLQQFWNFNNWIRDIFFVI